MASPRVTAVIVTYRSRATIDGALDALWPSHQQGLLRCIVVDNQSSDGTLEHVRRAHPWVESVDAGGNLGFGRGNNVGIQRAATPYVLLLNPDAVLPPPDLERLVAFLDAHPRTAFAGPAIESHNGTHQRLYPFPTPANTWRDALGRPRREDLPLEIVPGSAPRQVDWCCGAVMLCRKEVLDRLHGFDPRFFLYFEETDLCRRARALGFETWTIGEAIAHHVAHSSARTSQRPLYRGCIAEHYFESRFYYLRKHHGLLAAALAELGDAALTLARIAVKTLLRRPRPQELLVRLRAPVLSGPGRAG